MNKVKNYTDYNVVSFATDESFQDWIWHGRNDAYWQQVLVLYPGRKEDIEKAGELLKSIRFKESWPSKETVEESLTNALKNIEDLGEKKQLAPLRKLYRDKWAWASVAASVFFLIFGVWLGYMLGGEKKHNGQWVVNSKTVDGNRLTEIASAEGFKFILASNTQLSYKEEGSKNATIFLDGAAQFDFGNSGRNYIINTNQVITRTQNAKINISAFSKDSLVKVSVKEGIAELKGLQKTAPLMELLPAKKKKDKEKWEKEDMIEIRPNEEAVFHKGSNTTTIQVLDPNTAPFMKLVRPADISSGSGLIRFEDATLDNVLDRLKQKYHLQFDKEKDLNQIKTTFSGNFNIDENPFNILIMACNKFGLTYEMKEGIIVIKSSSNS